MGDWGPWWELLEEPSVVTPALQCRRARGFAESPPCTFELLISSLLILGII